jgi:hypothetical protein
LLLKPTFEVFCFNKSAIVPAPCLGSFQTCPFCPHEYGRNKSPHWQSSLCQCKATYSGISPGFAEAPLSDTLPMCHSPLQHRLRQATHNTTGLGCWSTVSYLFRDRPATRTGPRLSATRRRAR